MAKIGLVRVDDRLIHGQVVTTWINHTQSNRIIIVDDELVKMNFLRVSMQWPRQEVCRWILNPLIRQPESGKKMNWDQVRYWCCLRTSQL